MINKIGEYSKAFYWVIRMSYSFFIIKKRIIIKERRIKMSTSDRTHRILDIFYKSIQGEHYSVIELSDYYGVSKKTIARDIGEVRNFLSEYREELGNVTIVYDRVSKKYYLNKEFENKKSG